MDNISLNTDAATDLAGGRWRAAGRRVVLTLTFLGIAWAAVRFYDTLRVWRDTGLSSRDAGSTALTDWQLPSLPVFEPGRPVLLDVGGMAMEITFGSGRELAGVLAERRAQRRRIAFSRGRGLLLAVD